MLRIDETGSGRSRSRMARILKRRGISALPRLLRSGTGVIVDDVFLNGGGNQGRLRTAFGGLAVLWVGVTCDRESARAREAWRPDRVPGMAESQSAYVHEGVCTTWSSTQAMPPPTRARQRSFPMLRPTVERETAEPSGAEPVGIVRDREARASSSTVPFESVFDHHLTGCTPRLTPGWQAEQLRHRRGARRIASGDASGDYG